MKMTLHTLPLLPLVLLFLAISHPGYCCVQATAPKNLSSFPSAAFVTPKKSPSNNSIPASYTQPSIRRRVACSLSRHDEEEEDDTFFVQASQQATQRRMKQLKDGQDPMAISLSSPSSITGDVDDDKEVEIMEGGMGEDENEEEVEQSQPSSQEVKIPIDPFLKRQMPQQITKKPQTSYTFQRNLLKTRLLMDEKAKLANANKDLETASENKETAKDATTETLSSSVATEEKIPKSSKLEENFATSPPNADTTNTSLDSEKEKISMESQPATIPRLSSDGKAIFEPSPSSSTVDPEKVGMGLLVLTRSLLALTSILDREE